MSKPSVIKIEIDKEIHKSLEDFFNLTLLKNFFKIDFNYIFNKFIFRELNNDLDRYFKELNYATVNKQIYEEIKTSIQYIILFRRLMQFLRDKRVLGTIKKLEEIIRSEDYRSSKSFINSFFKIEELLNYKPLSRILFLIKTTQCFERDILLIWLQDIYSKHSPKNYHNCLSGNLKLIEKYFPEMFKMSISHGDDFEDEFKSNMNKIRKKVNTNLLKFKGI